MHRARQGRETTDFVRVVLKKNSAERIQYVTHVSWKFRLKRVRQRAWNREDTKSINLLNVAKKSRNEGPKRGPWTGRYQLLISLWSDPLWILQNQKFKLPVHRGGEAPSISPSQKSIIFRGRTDGRTNGQQNFWYPRTERALRAINSLVDRVYCKVMT